MFLSTSHALAIEELSFLSKITYQTWCMGGFTSQVQHWDKEQELMKIQRAERKI